MLLLYLEIERWGAQLDEAQSSVRIEWNKSRASRGWKTDELTLNDSIMGLKLNSADSSNQKRTSSAFDCGESEIDSKLN